MDLLPCSRACCGLAKASTALMHAAGDAALDACEQLLLDASSGFIKQYTLREMVLHWMPVSMDCQMHALGIFLLGLNKEHLHIQAAGDGASLDAGEPECGDGGGGRRGVLSHQGGAAQQGLHVDEPRAPDGLLLEPRGAAL